MLLSLVAAAAATAAWLHVSMPLAATMLTANGATAKPALNAKKQPPLEFAARSLDAQSGDFARLRM